LKFINGLTSPQRVLMGEGFGQLLMQNVIAGKMLFR
jgi:hypothetical protein